MGKPAIFRLESGQMRRMFEVPDEFCESDKVHWVVSNACACKGTLTGMPVPPGSLDAYRKFRFGATLLEMRDIRRKLRHQVLALGFCPQLTDWSGSRVLINL